MEADDFDQVAEQDDPHDLFGEAEDDELLRRDRGVDAEQRGPPIEVSAPLLPRPWCERVLFMKMPNVLRIDPRPFDPASFDGGYEELLDERGVKRQRPRDINVIRWRFRQGEDGMMERESNTRFVRWSDGSESIMLGDEVLNCDQKDAAKAHTYLYAVRYDVIEGQAHLSKRVTVAPATLDSKLHKRLRMTVQQAAIKQDKVRIHLAARNPDQEKADVEKRAEEAAKLKAQQDRAMGRTSARVQPRPTFISAAYLEEEEEQEQRWQQDAAGHWPQDEDDDRQQRRSGLAEEEQGAAQRLQSAKRNPPLAAGRLRGLDHERDEAGRTAAGIKVRRGAILDDDDD